MLTIYTPQCVFWTALTQFPSDVCVYTQPSPSVKLCRKQNTLSKHLSKRISRRTAADIIIYIFLPPAFSTHVPLEEWCGWSAIHSHNENHISWLYPPPLSIVTCGLNWWGEHLSTSEGPSQQRVFSFEVWYQQVKLLLSWCHNGEARQQAYMALNIKPIAATANCSNSCRALFCLHCQD